MDYMKQGDLIREVALPKAKMEGDFYLESHWGQASILLCDGAGVIEGYVARYNIKSDEFEFQMQNGVSAIAGYKVKSMHWIDSLKKSTRNIINAKDYLSNGKSITGFFEVLQDGTVPLFKKVDIDILKPSYNPSLSMGNKDFTVSRKEKYYYAIKNEVYLIKNRKSINRLDSSSPVDIALYLKQESLNLGNEQDIKKLFQYLRAKEN
jgi:hypothetical protein